MHVRRLRPLSVIGLALLVVSSSRANGPDWPVARGPARAAAPYRFDPTACTALPAGFLDDAAACILYSGTTHRIEADGTVETTTQELIRLNGRKGIDQLGEYRTITFTPAFEKVTLHEARVHKAKGGTETVAPRHVRLRDVNTDHQVYDLSKELVISFPGLEVGDVIEIHWTTRGKHPEYQGQLFYRYTFGHEKFPVARDEWCVRLPKGRPFRFAAVNGDLAPAEADEGEEHVYRWSASDIRAPQQGDRLPPADERQLQVTASTFGTWDDVFRWERNLVADRCACTPDVQRVVAEVTRGLTDPRDKAKALTQWVRRQVRYVSTGEKHDYTPAPPAEVVAHRYGDCKDTAHLLTVMLRAAGLRAGLVTIGTRGDGQVLEAVPSPWGNHALCLVTIDGHEHWIDTTANLIGWDVLPRDDRDRTCYVTDEQGLRVTRTPACTPADNVVVQTVHLSVGTDGSLRGERTAEYRGLAAWAKRDDFVDTPAGERRRQAAADLVDAYPKAKLRDLTFDDSLTDPDRPLTVRTTFEVPEHFTGDATREGALSDPGLWTQLLAVTVNPERTAALDLGDPFASVCRYVVHLPPTLRLAAVPAGQRVTSAWGSFRLDVKHDPAAPHRLELAFDTRLVKTRVEPGEFQAFQAFQESVQAAFRVALKLKPTDDSADTPLLEATLALAPGDADAAAALAELYVKAEKYDDADRVLGRARLFSPQERRLWELSITAAEDASAEGELLRQAVERFPGEWKFALALGENLLEQNQAADARKVFEPLTQHKEDAARGPALVALAKCSLMQEEPKKALRHLKAAAEAYPAGYDADTWLLQGQVHEALGQRGPAAEAFRKALEKEPDAPDVLDALVRLLAADGKPDEALGYLRRLVVAVGDDPDGLARAADDSVRLGRFDDAFELAGRAKGEDGQLIDLAYRPLGLALAHRGAFAEALRHLEKLEPDADVLTARLRARLALGDLTGAADDAARAKQIEEPTPELRRLAGRVSDLTRRRDEVASAGPPSAVEKFVCAEFFYGAGQSPERVDALLSEALADGGRLGPALGLRAVRQVGRGRLTQALADAEQAITLSPEDHRGYLARGRVRLERGRGDSLADLERAVTLSRRNDGDALHALAAALAQAGRKDQALAAQREAVKLEPGNKEFQEQLRELDSEVTPH
jgi:tetratricopeptide (TPR) repeat protein/transglutaminase-like putative cysteine protease